MKTPCNDDLSFDLELVPSKLFIVDSIEFVVEFIIVSSPKVSMMLLSVGLDKGTLKDR